MIRSALSLEAMIQVLCGRTSEVVASPLSPSGMIQTSHHEFMSALFRTHMFFAYTAAHNFEPV